MPLVSRISADVFVHIPPGLQPPTAPKSIAPRSTTTTRDARLIFFVPGNPGLLGYYHEFLARLAASEEGKAYVVVGMSLAGFEAGETELDWHDEELLFPDTVATRRSAKRRGEAQIWWSLEEQIDLTLARIDEVVRRLSVKERVKVTLMGHSLGTFMSLEVARKLHERKLRLSEPDLESSGVLGVGKGGNHAVAWEVESCICLAPTLVDLAKSASGLKAAPLLSTLTFLPWFMQVLAGSLTWAVNTGALQWLVARFLGLSIENAGVASTAQFLKSSVGVRQSLELAKQELISIARDDWGPEIWGTGQALQMGGLNQIPGPKLFFLFAQKDHWVADKTRDEILRTRARQDGNGAFVVDKKAGLKHAWCLEQNSAVLEYVRPWLRDISQSP